MTVRSGLGEGVEAVGVVGEGVDGRPKRYADDEDDGEEVEDLCVGN